MTNELSCTRNDCGETFTGPGFLAELRRERHLSEDHEPPWVEVNKYPRAPAKR